MADQKFTISAYAQHVRINATLQFLLSLTDLKQTKDINLWCMQPEHTNKISIIYQYLY